MALQLDYRTKVASWIMGCGDILGPEEEPVAKPGPEKAGAFVPLATCHEFCMVFYHLFNRICSHVLRANAATRQRKRRAAWLELGVKRTGREMS